MTRRLIVLDSASHGTIRLDPQIQMRCRSVERVLRATRQEVPRTKRILERNPARPLYSAIWTKP